MIKDTYLISEDNETLKNKLNITEYDVLNKAEADICFTKLIDIDKFEKNKLDKKLIKDIHTHIFEDIFEWAGEYRTVPIYKGETVLLGYSVPYAECKDIDKLLEKRIKDLNQVDWKKLDCDSLAETFARKLALLWRVHPFRDGNTRTTLSFAYIYAKKKGFPFSIEPFLDSLNRKYGENNRIEQYSIRDKFVLASLDDEYNPEVKYLASVFKRAITQNNKNNIVEENKARGK